MKTRAHLWFDDHRVSSGEALHQVVSRVAAALEQYEQGTRVRRRSDTADRTRETVIDIVIANLAYLTLFPPETGLMFVTTGNNGSSLRRYASPARWTALRQVLGQLVGLDLIDWTMPTKVRGEASTIAPTASLKAMVLEAGVVGMDFGRLLGEEVIKLAAKARAADKGRVRGVSILLDYPETRETTAMREAVRSFNNFLATADIAFLDDGQGPIDPHDRLMTRRFRGEEGDECPVFNRVGRLFGGFWQNLRKDRRGSIRINGEIPWLLDYSSMFPRLAYAQAGTTAPGGDLYAIPGLEGHRDAVKLLMNTLLNDSHVRRTTWPQDADHPCPPGWTVSEMRKAFISRHPGLASTFGTGVGLGLMFVESQIMMQVLTGLQAHGVVGLGLHDGLIVPASAVELTRELMTTATQEITSTTIPVTAEALAHVAPIPPAFSITGTLRIESDGDQALAA